MSSVPARPGKYKCPRCSHTREKNKSDKPLSVHYAEGQLFFKCFHCGWSGKVGGSDERGPISYAKPVYIPATPTDKLFEWFVKRGIPPDVVIRRKISATETWMPQTNKNERAIAFPYFRDGEIVNVKYRTSDKLFKMEKGAELTFYGLDDINPECVVIVEGEPDVLAVEVAGVTSCISVPNGTGTNLDILAGAEKWLDPVKKFILAGDTDVPGRTLQAELVRRLGAERCWRVYWPDDCKDANEVLVKHGKETVREYLDAAEPVPLEGVFEVQDCREELVDLFLRGRQPGMHPGWENLAPLYKPRLGQWTVITGSPGSGKSSFLRALLVNLAIEHDWKFVVFPPEDNPPAEYISQLIENYLGLPFDVGPRPRMTESEMLEGAAWASEHFIILNPPDGQRDLDSLLKLGRAMVYRRGINGFVIDPWNEVEHLRPNGTTETQYIESSLVRVRSFTQLSGIHTWIVAHPAKLQKENGVYPVPTLYDISGSASWFNKPDFGLSIWRNKQEDEKPVEIHVQKVRSRWCGQLGIAELYFDRPTASYSARVPDGLPRIRTQDRWLPYADADDMEPIG